jgi:hypothetical protein
MDVPPAVIDLDEPDAALDEPPCHERRVRKRAGLPGFVAPPREGALGLAGKIGISGTEDCMRKAISYCEIRTRVSGLPIFSC